MGTKDRTESQKALRVLSVALMAGLLTVPFYALQTGGWKTFFSVASVGCLLAGASAFVGGALGFLFGIPRTLQQEGLAPAPQEGNAATAEGALARRIDYRANTNLEQISDWLTKILVGVGLTQIPAIRSGLANLTSFAANGLGGQPHSQVYAYALLSYSTILGFLFGYLWTRLFLAGALRLADQAAIGDLVSEVQKVTEKAETTERKIEELKRQSELDIAALNLAHRQLNPSPEIPEPTQEALDAAIAAASRPIRVRIFNQAWQIRGENWRDALTKAKMERTIPLFRALIHNDPEGRFHMNHGQLAFALKDKRDPDWAGAEKELSKAIEIRGPADRNGWYLYEFNRSLCRVMLDPAFGQGQASREDVQHRILEDIHIASHAEDVKHIIQNDPRIQKWLSLNKVPEMELRRA